MNQISAGRFTAQIDDSFVVFLIGIRINRFLAFSKWLPTATAMRPMLATLRNHPEKGFLGAEQYFAWRQAMLIQYWQSFEDLERFARNPSDPHAAAWKRFNQSVGSEGSVGVWHETYLIEPKHYEAIYVNMPAFGLAAATERIAATGHRGTARGRLDNIQHSAPSS
jgi:hypothetical protein